MFRSSSTIDVSALAERINAELSLLKALDRPERTSEQITTDSVTMLGSKVETRAEDIHKKPARLAERAKFAIRAIPFFRYTVRFLRNLVRFADHNAWAGLFPLLWMPRHIAYGAAQGLRSQPAATVLCVGKWHPKGGQLQLVQAFAKLRVLYTAPVQLILAGQARSDAYFRAVEFEIRRLGLGEQVLVIKDPAFDELDGLYRRADLCITLSKGLPDLAAIGPRSPILMALAYGVPIVALEAGIAVPLLNSGGLILRDRDPQVLAAVAKVILEEPWLRRTLVEAGRHRFEFLASLSLIGWTCRIAAICLRRRRPVKSGKAGWRIEGPFDTSYSLAIVNREAALGLANRGESVSLVSRDGPGPYPPATAFLEREPAIAALWEAGEAADRPAVCLRNTYPPWVDDMRGDLCATLCYAWEESGFPGAYVSEFNRKLDLVTVTSRYVAKVLRDNGVRAPIRVIGNGIDQITRLDAAQLATDVFIKSVEEVFEIGSRFCFLHISSGLPRKGLDILFAAWGKAFRRGRDNVVLVVKASPNQHHEVDEEVAARRTADPGLAPIVVINEIIEREVVYGLYCRSNVVVAPSRGEGYGLPLAEALALGKPVITTAFGGQMDFCSADNAWLCDYDFVYAHSHVSTPLSVWAEPRVDSLVRALRRAYEAREVERLLKGQLGQARLRSAHRWGDVAARLQSAVADVQSLDARVIRLPKVGCVSTWNSRCGIAEYSRSLTSAFPRTHLTVFANCNADLLGPDVGTVVRPWEQGWRDPLDGLFGAIVDAGIDAAIIQFNFGFYALDALDRLTLGLEQRGIPFYFVLHATTDIERPDLTIRLKDAAASFCRARRLLVHSVRDLNRLKTLGHVENVTLLPFGLPRPPESPSTPPVRPARLIATFGYLLAHKGLPELIEAVGILRGRGIELDLLMLNALYPAQESKEMLDVCERKIAACGLSGHVELHTEYMEEDAIIGRLAGADLVVYPYQRTQESASAAVRLGLASLAPVAATDLPIFDDVSGIIHRLPGVTPAQIAAGIERLLNDNDELRRWSGAQKEWVEAQQWRTVSQRLYDLIRGDYLDDVLAPRSTVLFEPVPRAHGGSFEPARRATAS